MPFAMTHLSIAYNILSNTKRIKNPCEFMLGAVAPDAVHFIDNYNSDMKKRSHLCVGDEKWGKVTNNKAWMDNVLDFMNKNKDSENVDFIYGYCSHILADIQNNIKIWTPFLLENKEDLEKGLGDIYHKESFDIDYELYMTNPHQKEIFEMLENAHAVSIPNVINSDEINKMKYNLVHQLFKDRESIDVSSNRYVNPERIQKFITEESKYIGNLMFGE